MNSNNNEAKSILDKVDYYLKKRNFDLEYSDDRLKIFEELDEDNDILNYISSHPFRSLQVKKKKDKLSEEDPFLKKLDSISYYLLKSEFKNEAHKEEFLNDISGTVKNNALKNNKAYKRDYKIKETERVYGHPILSKYAMNRNRSDNYKTGKNKIREVFILNEYEQRLPTEHNASEAEAFDFIQDCTTVRSRDFNIYDRLVYSLKEPKNVLLFLRYEYEVLSEVSNFVESEVRSVSHVLDDIIQELNFDDITLEVIDCLKDGLDYSKIKDRINSKHTTKYTYDMIKYRVSETLNKISETIKDKISELI